MVSIGLSTGSEMCRLTVAFSNWDVDESKHKAAEIENNPLLLTSNILGWYPGQI